MGTIQVPSIILPTVWTLGTETEDIDDLVCHNSVNINTEYLINKTIHVSAVENIAAGMPGNLHVWVEISPYPSAITELYYNAIGGGGGPQVAGIPVIAPVIPNVIVATGVNNVVHTLSIPWQVHSKYARLVVWVPVAATPVTDYWSVQAMISAGG
jgi:hypothetical protein